jgi:hypothetical protein
MKFLLQGLVSQLQFYPYYFSLLHPRFHKLHLLSPVSLHTQTNIQRGSFSALPAQFLQHPASSIRQCSIKRTEQRLGIKTQGLKGHFRICIYETQKGQIFQGIV